MDEGEHSAAAAGRRSEREGTYTRVVMFTDVVSSTASRAQMGDRAADLVRRHHDELVEGAVVQHLGTVVKGLGDGMMAVFGSAADAVTCAVAVQHALALFRRRRDIDLHVRIGIAAGDVALEGDDYFGVPVVEASRLAAIAGGDGILVTELACQLAGSRTEAPYSPSETVALRGLPDGRARRVNWQLVPVPALLPLPDPLAAMAEVGVSDRAPELAELGDSWAAAERGRCQIVVLSGAAATGKTALLADTALKAHQAGAIVAFGRGEEGLSAPLRPVANALRLALSRFPAGGLERELELVGEQAPTESSRVPVRLFDAVADYVADLASRAPVVLAIDDLQWADPDTLRLVRHVATRAQGAPLLMLAAYRSGSVDDDDPLPRMVAAVRRHAGFRRIDLDDRAAAAPDALAGSASAPAAPTAAGGTGAYKRITVRGREGLCPVMVGRGRELARLTRLAARADAEGSPQVALVAGEAGVGKTRLVRELYAALEPGAVILAAQAEADELGRPYDLLLAAVEPFVRDWAAVPDDLSSRADAVRRLLHDVNERLECDDRTYGQQELVLAGVDVVRSVLGPRLGLIVFEDLHWADAESIALFVRLATAADLRALVVGTYRQEAAAPGHPIAMLGADLERRCMVSHVGLSRLTRGDVGALLERVYDGQVSYRAVDAAHQRTSGNPLFLEELLLAAGGEEPEVLAGLALPGSVTEAVLAQYESLPPDEREVMRAAAVLGQRVDFDVLGSVVGLGEAELLATLRGPVDRGLLIEEEEDRFAFRHAVTREAIAGTLFGREQRRLHEKALAAMQEAGSDDFAALAHHAKASGRFDEMVELARQGAWTYLKQGSTAEALRLAEMGLAHAAQDLALLSLATRAARALGVIDVATQHARRWQAAAAVAGDVATELAALYELARVRWVAADPAGHAAAVRAALALVELDRAPPNVALAYSIAAEEALLENRGEAAIEFADRCLVSDVDGTSETAHLSALVSRSGALTTTVDRSAEGYSQLEDALAEAERTGDTLAQQRAYASLLIGQVWHWPAARTANLVRQCGRLAEHSGDLHIWPVISAVVGMQLAFIAGDMAQAQLVLVEVRAERLTSHPTAAHWRDVLYEARLAIETDDVDRAARMVDEFVDDGAGGWRWPPSGAPWRLALAAACAARAGRLEDAVVALRAAVAATELEGTDRVLSIGAPGGRTWVLDALVSAVRAGLAPSTARTILERLGDGAAAMQVWPYPRSERHALAAVLEAEGNLAEADAAYSAAIQSSGHHEACLLADAYLGRSRCRLGLAREHDARADADAAAGLLTRWPGWRQQEVDAFRRSLGGDAAASASPEAAVTPVASEEAGSAEREEGVLTFRVLGDVAVLRAGAPASITGRQRRLLAVLLAHAGPVDSDRLADLLWGGAPPDSATNSLQSHISRLRRVVGSDRLLAGRAGYSLVLADDELDVGRFEQSVASARADAAAGRVAEAVADYSRALALWRGRPFAEFADEEFAVGRATQVEQLRLAAIEEVVECRLALGEDAQLVAELERLTLEHPLRERLWSQRMLALYRAGRQADALRAFADLRHVLASELGISPGPEAARLEAAILAQDPSLHLGSSAS
jgi:DNA-binding SARP family transcriptional activator/class 3 adenylate cyclase